MISLQRSTALADVRTSSPSSLVRTGLTAGSLVDAAMVGGLAGGVLGAIVGVVVLGGVGGALIGAAGGAVVGIVGTTIGPAK